MRDKSHWRNTLLLSQALLLALYPMTSAQAQTAPVGNGFTINAEDLRFIFHAIEVAQANSAGGVLLGSGPNQVNLNTPISAACANGAPCPGDPQLPVGLRTVDGTFNNIVPIPDQHLFGAADLLFPRLTTPRFRAAEGGTSYATIPQTDVIDSQPRIISNLIVDQSENNPAAKTVATNPCGSGGFVCSTPAIDPAHPLDPLFTVRDPNSGALFIPNITPDFGLSAPFNLMFTFFGQFFDHGLDLVTKGGSGTVIMPLQPDDPLFVPGSPTNFMVMARGQNQPGPDGILGTADDLQETMNTTTPWVDQNQTYTSHPSHQVFLRQYDITTGRPLPDGKVLDGGHCSPRGTGIPGDEICNIGNWAEVKAQAATKLGIRLTDADLFDVPKILTDPYGHFKPGPRGFPQLVRVGNVLVEGNPVGGGIAIPGDVLRTGHAFLNDIAHNAVPNPGLIGVRDGIYCDFRSTTCTTAPGTYDGDVLDAHMVTGDGRGNENIALTMVHQIFHAEHNRLRHQIDGLITTLLTPAEVTAWHAVDPASGWGYGERLFQAARFVTEMEYQHLVFEEFARKVQPLINPFLGGITSINGVISAEFAHTVYRLGHSMLPEVVGRTNTDGSPNDVRLLNAFLNPALYNEGGTAGSLTAAEAAGSIIRGVTRQVGNELDEFTTSSVRNTLVGLPLDLPAINIARGRSEGIPPMNLARRQFFAASADSALR
ncbi:MAG: peroxidase family protein, partial [Myxococcales bacterium]